MAKIVFPKMPDTIDEGEVIAWAQRAFARLRRLLARVESDDPDVKAEALAEIYRMKRRTIWPRGRTSAEIRTDLAVNDAARLLKLYKAVLPLARRAKAHFSPYFDDGITLGQDDIDEFLRREPKAVSLAKALNFTWSTDLITDLCRPQPRPGKRRPYIPRPSDWLISRFGDKLDVSDQTVKNMLQRKHPSRRTGRSPKK